MIPLGDIVGQDAAVEILRRALAEDRLHHALLFAGPAGVGKHTTALALARLLLCRDSGSDACGDCAACIGVAAGSHPDLRRLALATDKREISIEDVRDLQAALGRRTASGGRRAVIVDDADSLSEPAQNAFLKLLEEPPEGTTIVLVAHQAARLLPTVRSRCHRIPFGRIDPGALARLLEASHGRSPEEARFLAWLSDGSLGTALSADSAAARQGIDAIATHLDRLEGGDPREVAEAARTIGDLEKASPNGTALLLRLLRSRLRAAAGLPEPGAAELTPHRKTENVTDAVEACEAVARSLGDLSRNANRTLTIERMLFQIAAASSR